MVPHVLWLRLQIAGHGVCDRSRSQKKDLIRPRHLDQKPGDLGRYVDLMSLSDRNETVFYKAPMSDPARFVPIVYDPMIADACLTYKPEYRERS